MTHYLPSTIKPLLGKKLKQFINADPATIIFDDGATVVVSVDGDCCSSSYIYDVIEEGLPAGTSLLDVSEHDTDSPQPNEVQSLQKATGDTHEGDSLSQWDIRFRFDGGSILIRHINNSNGYYDGMTSYEVCNP